MDTTVTTNAPVLLAQANISALPADVSVQPMNRATEGLRSVKVVDSQMQDGNAVFTLPVSQADVKSVQVLDLDMLVVLNNGEGLLLREGAFLATTKAAQKVIFGGGDSLPLSDLLKQVGLMKPSETASFRLSSTEVKLGKSEAPGGQGLNLGKGDDDAQTSSAQEEITQLIQSLQNARLSDNPVREDSQPVKPLRISDNVANPVVLQPAAAPGDVKKEDSKAANETETTLTSKWQPQASFKITQVELVNATPSLENLKFSDVLSTSPLKVQMTGTTTGVNPAWGPDASSTSALGTLKISQLSSATSLQISIAPSSHIPDGLTINGQTVTSAGGTFKVSSLTAGASTTDLALTWAVSAHPTVASKNEYFEVAVKYFNGSSEIDKGGKTLTFWYGQATEQTLNWRDGLGNSYHVLPSNGYSYDINGTAGNDNIIAWVGDDVLRGGEGADTLNGGLGQDTAAYDVAASDVTVSLKTPALNTGEAVGDIYIGIENLRGSAHNDLLIGDDQANRLEGVGGNDTLEGGAGADTLDGGTGTNLASYENATQGVKVYLDASLAGEGEAEGDVFTRVQGLRGSQAADTLYGDSQANTLQGLGGDDILSGGLGDDTLDGGLGQDTLIGGAGNDSLLGGQGQDNLDGGSGNDALDGGDGLDTLQGGAGQDVLDGGAGDDMLLGGADADTLLGGLGQDTLSGDEGNDVLSGDDGNDILYGGAGADTLLGGADDDTLVGGVGADSLVGGAGQDLVSYASAAEAVVVDLGNSLDNNRGADALGDEYNGIEAVEGSVFDDKLSAGSLGVQLIGGLGHDTLVGNAGADTLDGGVGNDSLSGGDAADLLMGGEGDDTLVGGLGADTFFGGAGTDTVSYADFEAGLVIRMDGLSVVPAGQTTSTGEAIGDSFDSIEKLIASQGNDTVYGSGGVVTIDGGAGNDRLIGTTGANVLMGGVGNDTLEGLGGGDTLMGGDGTDWVDYSQAQAGMTVYLDGSATSSLRDVFSSIENVQGSAYADDLHGDAQSNTLLGGAGDDTLTGGAGADSLVGGEGSDTASYVNAIARVELNLSSGGTGGDAEGDSYTDIERVVGSAFNDKITGNASANIIQGGDGDDELVGGGGSDVMYGGAGSDILSNSGAGTHQYYGGSDVSPENEIDTVSYEDLQTAVNVSLLSGGTNGAGGTEKFFGIDNLTGSRESDFIEGDGNVNTLRGKAGNDSLSGLAGNDQLFGDVGDDWLDGGLGADLLNGGDGTDTASYLSYEVASNAENLQQTGLTIDLSNTAQSQPSATSSPAVGDVFSSIEVVVGSYYRDTFKASSEATRFEGGDADGSVADTVDYSASTLDANGAGVTITLSNPGIALASLTPGQGGWAAGDTFVSIENLTGSAGKDLLTGNNQANVLQGGAGDDTIIGGAGNDTLDGGEGVNTLSYADKTTAVSLTLLDAPTAITVSVGTGTAAELDSVLNFRNVIGGTGQDTLTGNAADNDLSGGGGNDSLSGLAGADTLRGGAGNDNLLGGGGNDNLLGEGGDDTLIGGTGADVLDGGDGVNTASYASSSAVTVNLASNTHLGGDAAGDSLINIQNVIGSAQTDRLTGDNNANQLQGDAGDDGLDGGEGNDTLIGGLGNDTLLGGMGFDSMDGSAGVGDVNVADYSASKAAMTVDLSNTSLGAGLGTSLAQGDVLSNIQKVVGSAQDDTFVLADSSVTQDFDGGLGLNTVSFQKAASFVTATLQIFEGVSLSGAAVGKTFTNIQNLTGSNQADVLGGKDGESNLIMGGQGNDTLLASTGNDTLDGGAGTDRVDFSKLAGTQSFTIDLDAAGDAFVSWGGSQTAQLISVEEILVGAGDDSITGNLKDDVFLGGGGNDTLNGAAGQDTLDGGVGNDSLLGGAGNDSLLGGGGDDKLLGETGDDNLLGGAGSDILLGGDGKDVLLGGAGADSLDGGTGDDFASYGDLISGITINLGATGSSTGDAQGDTYSNIEGVIGTGGNDTIYGAAGFTTLLGGAGDDTFFASSQAESMDGQSGKNTVDYSLSSSAVTVNLSDTNPEAGGFAAGDTLVNINKVIGSSFNDKLTAGSIAMTFLTGDGQDSFQGGAGNDTLDLKTANTTLNDTARAGAGDDTFIVEQSKINSGTGLIDGESGSDTLQLHMSSNGTLDFTNFSNKDSLFNSINTLDMTQDGQNTSLQLTAAGIRALVGNTSDTGAASLNITLTANLDSVVSTNGNFSAAAGSSVTFNFGSDVSAVVQWV